MYRRWHSEFGEENVVKMMKKKMMMKPTCSFDCSIFFSFKREIKKQMLSVEKSNYFFNFRFSEEVAAAAHTLQSAVVNARKLSILFAPEQNYDD